jgi:RNA polymerase sigma-70 factor (ECF subfamily)
MSLVALPQLPPEHEAQLVQQAKGGDESAFLRLVDPWRKPLFAYIYRMVTRRSDAEDLLQDVLVRVLENLREYRGEGSFKSWLFGIATHVCLDHLRRKTRWRVDAQLEAERHAENSQTAIEKLTEVMSRPDSAFEIREHIAYCFSCLGRTLEPQEQAALLLKEVLGFRAEEGAKIVRVSEPVFRHRLSAARKTMTETYEGLCQLVSKGGACWQCRGLREVAPEPHRGAPLVQIEVAPGVAVSPESLFDARLRIVREADLEDGRTRELHAWFFDVTTEQEEGGRRDAWSDPPAPQKPA